MNPFRPLLTFTAPEAASGRRMPGPAFAALGPPAVRRPGPAPVDCASEVGSGHGWPGGGLPAVFAALDHLADLR